MAKISGEMKVRSTKNSLTSSMRTLNQVTNQISRKLLAMLMTPSSQCGRALGAVAAGGRGDQVHVRVLQRRLARHDLANPRVAE